MPKVPALNATASMAFLFAGFLDILQLARVAAEAEGISERGYLAH